MHDTQGAAAPPPSELQENLKALLEQYESADAGFEALGKELGAAATGEDPGERGRAAFERRIDEIRKAVCGSERIRLYCSDSNYADSTAIAALVAGALIASHFSGLNVLLVACICVRLGLRNLCQRHWGAADE